MASDREDAKNAIASRETTDAELSQVFSDAHKLQLETAKETNRHEEAKLDKKLGFFGKALGDADTAPVVVAAVVVILGFAAFFVCLIAASRYQANPDFWAKQGERGLGIGSAALAYIFGRGSSSK